MVAKFKLHLCGNIFLRPKSDADLSGIVVAAVDIGRTTRVATVQSGFFGIQRDRGIGSE